MKQIVEKTKVEINELNDEELQNTFGGSWWEIRGVYGEIVFIFHPYDYDYEE